MTARLARGRALVAAGADIVDVGGESARGDRPAVSATRSSRASRRWSRRSSREARWSRSTPTSPRSRRRRSRPGPRSSTTSRGCATRGWRSCARAPGRRSWSCTRAVEPKGTLLDPGAYEDVAADVRRLPARAARGRARGGRGGGAADPRSRAGLRQDAGADGRGAAAAGRAARVGPPDPARRLAQGLPRRDHRARAARIATRARWPRWASGVDAGAAILRVHDVAGAADFLAVRAVLRGERGLGPLEGLTPERYPDGVPPDLALG